MPKKVFSLKFHKDGVSLCNIIQVKSWPLSGNSQNRVFRSFLKTSLPKLILTLTSCFSTNRKPEKIDCILELSKNTKLEMGSERFEAVEGLFKPELWGLDQAGVHVLVHKAIRECSMDVRKEITQSIFLAGGLSMIP